MQADSYKLKYSRQTTDIELHKTLKDILLPEITTLEQFSSFIDSARIESYNADDNRETYDSVFNHLFIEYEESIGNNTQKYFILNIKDYFM